MAMSIRTATPDDAPELARVIREAFRGVAERFHLTEANAAGQSPFCTAELVLADMSEGQTYHLLEHEGAVRGCVATVPKTPEILYARRLAVLPTARGGGLGLELVAHVVAEARRLRRTRIEFGAISDNVELIAWYLRLGFAVKEKRWYDYLPFEVTYMYLDVASWGTARGSGVRG
jgi:ribosomal protein S18 acetylase RimI-like enzyme